MAADPAVVDQVLGKLTQLRMELAAEGRVILDEMIVGQAAEEVTGHKLTSDAADPGAADPGAMISGRFELVGEEYQVISP